MNELMIILKKCFDVLYPNKKDLSWSTKYYSRYKEEELLEQLAELEDLHQDEQKRNPRLAHVSLMMMIRGLRNEIKRHDESFQSAPSSKSSFSSWSSVSFADVSFHWMIARIPLSFPHSLFSSPNTSIIPSNIFIPSRSPIIAFYSNVHLHPQVLHRNAVVMMIILRMIINN